MSDLPNTARADYPVIEIVPTRWEDIDVYGHVNNVKYYSYFDTAVNGWLVRKGLLDPRTNDVFGVVVETACVFRRELVFPVDVHAGLRIARLGQSSVTYDIGLFPGESVDAAAHGRFVHVYVDRGQRRPCPIPPDVRAALETLHRPSL